MADYDLCEKLFAGKWKHDRDENIEAFMDAIGAPEEDRKMAEAFKSAILTNARVGSQVSSTMEMGQTKFEVKFAFGEESEFKDNAENPKIHIKTTTTMKGNVMHQDVFNVKRNKRYTNDISVDGDSMINTTTCDGVTMKRIYKRA